jgi:hypothetical protein
LERDAGVGEFEERATGECRAGPCFSSPVLVAGRGVGLTLGSGIDEGAGWVLVAGRGMGLTLLSGMGEES